MSDLKPISRDSIPAALQKAERYRLLGEPTAVERLRLDVLALERGADHVRPRLEQDYEPSPRVAPGPGRCKEL